MGDPEGGGLKEMDDKLKKYVQPVRTGKSSANNHSRVENMKDMVLYRFGSTGVVQCLTRAADLLGLVPVFPVRNLHTFSSGTGTAVFRDCILVKRRVEQLFSLFPITSANIQQKQYSGRCRP